MAAARDHEDLFNKENIPPKNFTAIPQKKDQITKKETRIAFQPLHHFDQDIENQNLQNKESEKSISKNRSLPGELVALTQPITNKLTLDTSLDQQLEIEYEEDIFQYLFVLEKTYLRPEPNYMLNQMHINWDMRSILIDWLASVADEFKMNERTLHLSVVYLDKFLSSICVIHEKLQLVGVATMFIAGKLEELTPITAKEWAYLTDNAYTARQIIQMERLILKVLNFNINPPTVFDFIKYLCYKHKLDGKTTCLALYLSELVLLEGQVYLEHVPSELAASSIVLARHILSQSEPSDRSLEDSTGYTFKQLRPIVKKQHATLTSSQFRRQQTIQNKYKSDKFYKVALLKPTKLKLDDKNDEEQ